MRKLLLAAIFACALASPAAAQNQTCPTRPVGDSTNACASTAFVNGSGIGLGGFTPNLPVIGSAGGFLTQGTRSGNTTSFGTTTGALTNGHCVSIDSNGNLIDAGGACTTGGGGGTVSAGTSGQLGYYASSGTTISGTNAGTGVVTALGNGVDTVGGLARATFVTPQDFAAAGSAQNTTGTISATSSSLALAAAQDFANTNGIRINHAGAAFTLNQPSGLTVTPTGTTGATAYQYTIASLDAAGGIGATITGVSTATGNAALNSTNYNALAWSAPSGTAPAAYLVCGNKSGSLIPIAVVTTTSYQDMGVESFSPADWFPTTCPVASALADWLITTISSGGGTTTLTLGTTATTTATSQYVIHDDTAPLQSWLNSAVSSGLVAYIPHGTYPISTTLTASGPVTIDGVGYQGDGGAINAGNGYGVQNISSLTGKSAVILPVASINAMVLTSNYAFHLFNFEILYQVNSGGFNGSAAWPLTVAITVKASTGSTSNNTGTVVRDVMVYGADASLQLTNLINFTVDQFKSYIGWRYGVIVDGSNYPSFGDSNITNSEIGGCCNNTALLPQGYIAGVVSVGGAGLRIVNNKFNWGNAVSTTFIELAPSYASQSQEPFFIDNNSVEGGAVCVGMVQNNASATIDLLGIVGNELWCGTDAIAVAPAGTSQWILGMNVIGNHLQVNGAAGVTVNSLDNVGGGVLSGNYIGCAGVCSGGTGWNLASHTTNLNVQGNTYAAAISTQVNNLGAGNQVGIATK